MAIVDRLKRVFGSGTAEEGPFTYRCRACNHLFESAERDVDEVRCTECGDRNVRRMAK